MIRSWTAFICVAALALLTGMAVSAQTAATPTADVRTNTMVPSYDITKEVKIQGTIRKIETAGTSALGGTHVTLQTASGAVDVNLGFGPVSKPSYLGISQGQSVTIVGMMQTVGADNILLARILTTSSRVFVLRNEHGIPVRAIPHAKGQTNPVMNSKITMASGANLQEGL